eukprot:TRINITY_DN6652_c0_g1_i11.p1 TRINITY_DN6652_c0_g1~~TRINITY_DN6652_c0_g1_i11.p1  ORF type:complete len:632 (-),score=135.07 TRINITY_DN6652_c0_g1_i11:348-2243(-)
MNLHGTTYTVGLWDTAGQEDYDRLRPLSYPQTDIFFVCFSLISRSSLENVRAKWYPEVSHHCPGAIIALIGTKSDLLSNPTTLARLAERRLTPIQDSEAEALAAEINAIKYFKTSALHGTGLQEAFETSLLGLCSPMAMAKAKKKQSEPVLLPPILPKQKSAPYIEVMTNRFAEDMKGLLNSGDYFDLLFEVEGHEIRAHKIILASSSQYFCKLLLQHQDTTQDDPNMVKEEDGEAQPLVEEEDVPEEFVCPISREIMIEPVIAEDGHTYERQDVFDWISKKGTSPITREKISPNVLIINRALKAQIEQWRKSKGVGVPKGVLEVRRSLLPKAIKSITNRVVDGRTLTKIVLASTVKHVPFSLVLEFLYTGVLSTNEKELMEPLKSHAEMFEVPHLSTYCSNVQDGLEELNPSIGTWLNDQTGEKAIELFFNKPLFSDVTFNVTQDGVTFFAHKAMVSARCTVLQRMFASKFVEANQAVVKIDDASQEAFSSFLTFLYSAHSPIENSDSCGILELANCYALPRLVTLCELYISKMVERATKDDITKAEISVIDLLLLSQQHNAKQLEKFCLHFISANYQPMSARPDFKNLKGENLKYVEENQWPPLSYLRELEAYEKATGTPKSSEGCSLQ